jgi:mono/diheme cytochrome c family protein
MNISASLLLLGASAFALSGCRGDRHNEPPRQFFQDMKDSPKWKSQSQTEFYSDSRTMRPSVKGTVAFGRTSFAPEQMAPSATTTAGVASDNWAAKWEAKQADLLREDDRIYAGKGADGSYLVTIPVKVDADLLARGEKWYNITCATCHGYDGDGKGMVGKQWSYALPNFHDAKYFDTKADQGKDGYLYHTAMLGVWDTAGNQKMPGYAHALSPTDAWGVVAYIRVLQETRKGTINDVPQGQREELMRVKPQPTAPAPAANAPSTPAPAAPSTGGTK